MNSVELAVFRVELLNKQANVSSVLGKLFKGGPVGNAIWSAISGVEGAFKGLRQARAFNLGSVKNYTKMGKEATKNLGKIKIIPSTP